MAATIETDKDNRDGLADGDPRKGREHLADLGPNPMYGRTVTWSQEDGRQVTGKFLFNVLEPGQDGRKYAYVEYPEDVTGTLRQVPIAYDDFKFAEPKEEPHLKDGTTFGPTPIGPDGLNIGGDKGGDISDEEKARRAAILAAELRALDEETAAEAEAQAQKKRETEAETNRHHRDRTILGSIYMRGFMDVQTGDNFFKVKSHEKIPGQHERTLSDKQLKAVILSAALEKNWSTIYFYKGRSEIDPQLTARANAMIQRLQMPGQPLEGIELNASPRRMREVEPWNEKRWLYSAFRDMANKREDVSTAVSHSISSKWNGLARWAFYGNTAEEGPGFIKRWTTGALSAVFGGAATGAALLADKMVDFVKSENEPGKPLQAAVPADTETRQKPGVTVTAGPGRAM